LNQFNNKYSSSLDSVLQNASTEGTYDHMHNGQWLNRNDFD